MVASQNYKFNLTPLRISPKTKYDHPNALVQRCHFLENFDNKDYYNP